MSSAEFAQAITCEAIPGASDQCAIDVARYTDTWHTGEAVPSRYYTVGSFVIAPGTLEQFEEELQHPHTYYGRAYDLSTRLDTGEWSNIVTPITPLQQFVMAAGDKLRDFVAQDIGLEPGHPKLTVSGLAGPYEQPYSTTWHHDDLDDIIGSRTYTATLLGPTTEFGIGNFKKADYDYEEGTGFLLSDVKVPQVEPAKLLAINLHDQTWGLHQSPNKSHEGQPRIFVNCVVDAEFIK